MRVSNIIGIHHLGIAVNDIDREALNYVSLFGFKKETGILFEPPMKVNVQFLTLDSFRIELVRPSSNDSPIQNFLDKGGILNHLCYESSDIEATVNSIKSNSKAFQTVPITKASTLKNCVYTFFAKPSGEVIEIIHFSK